MSEINHDDLSLMRFSKPHKKHKTIIHTHCNGETISHIFFLLLTQYSFLLKQIDI